MKKRIVLFVLFFVFCASINAFAEIVYLKDGQVIRGTIISEDDLNITVKTQYQTKQIKRSQISRIMYGDRDLEEINILMNDGSIINGFLIDQDNKQVIIRKEKNNPKETVIEKTKIKQMSQKEIIPLQPQLSLKIGMFYPLSSKGGDFDPSLMFSGSIGTNLTAVKSSKMFLEGGYTKSKGKAGENIFLQIIPITLNFGYALPLSSIAISTRIGAGIAVVEFDDNLGTPKQGYDFVAMAGAGIEYELAKKTLILFVNADYMLVQEKETRLNSIVASIGFTYIF